MTRGGLTRPWTDAQNLAIGARGRTLVAAAAGSGKTGVLTERIVRALLGDGGDVSPPLCTPGEILAVTFTRKAAAEMRSRIGDELLGAGRADLVGQLELATIGTIHSLCAEILRRHGAAVGVDPGFTTLEESQDAWFAQLALDDALTRASDDPDVAWLRARMRPGQVVETVRSLRSRAARSLDGQLTFSPDEHVLANDQVKVVEGQARRATRAFERIWAAFRDAHAARLAAAGALTFDDLELLALECARVPEVGVALRARWQMVAIDEFQDTNARQLALLDEIAADRLFMVGDEWQSIYRFRGADVDVFRAQHAQTDGTLQVPMRENFRSDGPVLDVVNRIFEHSEVFGERYEPVIAGTEKQRVVDGPCVELLVVDERVDELTSHIEGVRRREREVRRVAERIDELVHGDGVRPDEIVVLGETRTGFSEYEAAIRARGIATISSSSTGFFDRRDVRDALAVLAAVRNPMDDRAALALLAGPLGRLDLTTVAELAAAAGMGRRARGSDVPRISVLDAARVHELDLVRRAAATFDELARIERKGSLVELVSAVVDQPQLALAAAAGDDGVQRTANLVQLVELADEARGVGVRDVARFLDYVDAQRRHRRIGDASIADEASGAVRMMTIHASKGLEFSHVFLVEAGRSPKGGGSFDQVPDPLVDEHGAVHVAVLATDGKVRDTGTLARLRQAEETAEAHERMRKLYVAMTRAEHRLYVSGCVASDRLADVDDIDPGAGTLEWCIAALGVQLPASGAAVEIGDPSVRIDARAASTVPEPGASHARDDDVVLAPRRQRLELVPIVSGRDDPPADSLHAFRSQLAATVADAAGREWRLADGSRLHDVVARLLDHAVAGVPVSQLLGPEVEPWLGRRTRERLAPVIECDAFRRLVELRARPEVPFVVGTGAVVPSLAAGGVEFAARAEDVRAGRFDALVRLADGRWWILDWKATLPEYAAEAWTSHGAQLARYAEAARIGGATGVVLTLVSLEAPEIAHSWDGSDVEAPDVQRGRLPAMPPACDLPEVPPR